MNDDAGWDEVPDRERTKRQWTAKHHLCIGG